MNRATTRSPTAISLKKIGDNGVIVTLTMTPEEYMAYRTRRLQTRYFRSRNHRATDLAPRSLSTLSTLGDKRNPNDPPEPFFVLGECGDHPRCVRGVDGVKHDRTENPTLPQRARRRTTFDMGQDIRVNLNAKVGEKIDFDINYDSQEGLGFDMEARKIKLAYKGDER